MSKENIQKRQGTSKKDSKGNQLPEEIGKGLNFDHPSPEIQEKLTEKLQVLMGRIEAENFTELCKPYGGVSKVFRDYARAMLKIKKENK